jgi:hypothetical protein
MDPQQQQQRRPPPPPPSAPPPSWKTSTSSTSATQTNQTTNVSTTAPNITPIGVGSASTNNRPKPPPPRQPPPSHHHQPFHSHHTNQSSQQHVLPGGGGDGAPPAAGELRRSESSSSASSYRGYDGSSGGARRYMDDNNRFENRRYPSSDNNYPPVTLQRRASFETSTSGTPRPYGFGGDGDRSDRGGGYERGWGERGERYGEDRRRFGVTERDRDRDRERPDRFGGDRAARDVGFSKDITRTGSSDNLSSEADKNTSGTNNNSFSSNANTSSTQGGAKRKPPPPSGPPPIARRASSDGGAYPQQVPGGSLTRNNSGFSNGPLMRSSSSGSVRDDRKASERVNNDDTSPRNVGGVEADEQVEPGEVIMEEGEIVIQPPVTVKIEKDDSTQNMDVVSAKEDTQQGLSESASVTQPTTTETATATTTTTTDEKSRKHPKQATDEEGTPDDDSGDGGSKKGKQKKSKRRKLVIDTTAEPDQDIEEEITPSSTSAALRKRRKSRQISQDSTDTGAAASAPARAAKTRAQELIAKPKIPAGAPGSLTPTGPSTAPSTQITNEKSQAPLSPIPSAVRGVSQSSSKSSNLANATAGRSVGGLGGMNGAGEDKRRKSRVFMDEAELREEWKRVLISMKQQQPKVLRPPLKIAVKPFLSAVTKGRPTSSVIISRVHQRFQRQTLPHAYTKPQEAPGWEDLEGWAQSNRTFLLSSLQKRFILEQNHAKMVLEDLQYLQVAWKKEEEMKVWKAAQEAQQPGVGGVLGNKRYPSRNNPAAIAIELGQQEHGVAEQERRERERRKNAAVLPDLEFGMEYGASLLERQHRDTTDGRPAMCFGRMDGADCVLPGESLPPLLIPSPLGCNCSRAVAEAKGIDWTDIERCIFLDKFLQFPKDFQRIASFLRNKSTEDVIAFYYDTKKVCDYKSYMNEHHRRRNRDQSDLVGIREQYLGKLGVKLPLNSELDGIRKFSRVKDEPVLKGVRLPTVLLSATDVFPKQLSEIALGVDLYPRPCIVADFAPQIDPQDLQNFLLRNS